MWMISSHLAPSRERHLEQVLHIFAHLKKHHNTEMVHDPSDLVIDEFPFKLHLGGKEELPDDVLEPTVFGFTISAEVDASH